MCLNIFNNLCDRWTLGYEILPLYVPVNDNTLSDVDIAIATNKGWTITY